MAGTRGKNIGVSKTPWYTMLPEKMLLRMEHKTGLYLIGLGVWAIPFVFMIIGVAVNYVEALEFTPTNGQTGKPFDWMTKVFGILFSGTVFTAIALRMKEELQELVLMQWYSEHVVICGLGAKGWHFLKSFREAGNRVVAIEKDPHNPNISRARRELAIVIVGDATDPDVLTKAKAFRAIGVICVAGEDHTNADTAVKLKEIVIGRDEAANEAATPKGKTNRDQQAVPHCMVHIYSPELCDLLRPMAIELWAKHKFTLEFFNVFETGATLMVGELERLAGSDHSAIPRHILVIGFGWVGQRVVCQIAKKWQSALNKSDKGEQLKISVIDREFPEEARKRMLWKFPALFKHGIITLHRGDAEVRPILDAWLKRLWKKHGRFAEVYVCLNQQTLAVSTALNLHLLFRRLAPNRKIPISVRVDQEGGFQGFFDSDETPTQGSPPEVIRVFGLFEKTCNANLLVTGNFYEELAKSMHEVYLRTTRSRSPEDVSGNPNVRPWDGLSLETKNDNRDQVHHTIQRLREMGFYIDHIDQSEAIPPATLDKDEITYLAALEHERWKRFKENHGWTQGESRNDAKKIHPRLVDWEKLGEKEIKLNKDFIREFPENLKKAELAIYRTGRE